jgi:periplasmic divalent cation tolerance protein
MTNSFPLLMVHTTCAGAETAERLARGLVEARVAACVSIGAGVRSVYAWQGRVEIESEVPLLIKTTAECLPALKRFILDHHDYEVPELLVTPVVDGHEPYLRWAREWVKHDR